MVLTAHSLPLILRIPDLLQEYRLSPIENTDYYPPLMVLNKREKIRVYTPKKRNLPLFFTTSLYYDLYDY